MGAWCAHTMHIINTKFDYAQNMRISCDVKPRKKRLRKPTNITLDEAVKKESSALAANQATNLSQLVNDLLVERLKAEGMWPPKN